ncbi:18887_t:CDS:1, partial [Dentiscutata erythropus]
KSEVTTISYTEERQEVKNSLLYKEINRPKKNKDLEDFEHRYWLNNLIQKQLRNGLELTQYYSLRNFKTIRLTPEKTEDVKSKITKNKTKILPRTIGK